MNDNLKNM